jgi:DNA-binding MarR family transcriptional regulator
MTEHELLYLLNEETSPDRSVGLLGGDIADYFDYDQASTYGRLSRLRQQGLVWRAKSKGATLYGITEKGKARLEYFEENGCGKFDCSSC